MCNFFCRVGGGGLRPSKNGIFRVVIVTLWAHWQWLHVGNAHHCHVMLFACIYFLILVYNIVSMCVLSF